MIRKNKAWDSELEVGDKVVLLLHPDDAYYEDFKVYEGVVTRTEPDITVDSRNFLYKSIIVKVEDDA